MAVFAIGDIQGCDSELGELLHTLNFSASRDRIWFVGDLVNRGPESLETLRRIRELGDAATVTLGNHDLHLLALAFGVGRKHRDDTLDAILSAPDREPLLEWLIGRPLLHEDPALETYMLHAGLAPQWDLPTARACAREFERALRHDPEQVFQHLYGDQPDRWDDALSGMARLRFIVNCFTRLRYVDADGRLMLRAKGSPSKATPKSLVPWFDAPHARWRANGRGEGRTRGPRVVFGHWSTLGLFSNPYVTSLDTGCVWGGCLTAMRLDVTGEPAVQVKCRAYRDPGD